ncbi:MAG: HAD-IB family phosphatase [Acidimicrobiales bacterium]
MDLPNASVFLDFDGTITTEDTGVYLLDHLAPPSWRQIETLYKTGEIGSRECLVRQWALLPRDRAAIEAAVREVPLDAGFAPLITYLVSEGAEVTILSDGYGFRAQEVARDVGVEAVTNAVDWERHAVLFPNAARSCPCGLCGTCKRSPINAAKERGRQTILVGDGASDAQAAQVADIVFAKAELADRCKQADIRYYQFESLLEVIEALSSA